MRLVVVAAVVVLGACGRVAFDVRDDAATAADSTQGPDALALSCTQHDFSSGLPVGWETWSGAAGVSASVMGSQIVVQVASGVNGYAGTDTTNDSDFTGGRLTVDVVNVFGDINVESYITVHAGSSASYALFHENGVLTALRIDGESKAIAYSPSLDRHWRIQHHPSTNTVSYETSPDRVDWRVIHAVDATIAVTAMSIEFAAGAFNGGASITGATRYDDVELCVPRP